jgi:hypothetical protein
MRPLLVVVMAALLACLAQPATAADRYTPIVPSVMSMPRWFEDSRGRIHLAYELRMVNGFPVPVTVTSVSVRDVNRRRPIERLAREELTAATSLMASPGEPATVVPPSSTAVVWFDIVLPGRAAVPRRISHRVSVSVPPGLPVPELVSLTGARARVDRRPPIALAPPLRGPGWIAVGSCCDGPHRRALQPVNGRLRLGQRFAIDWNGMDDQNRFVVGDPRLNTSWVFYGAPVLAVASARVVAAADRFPDQIPTDPRPVTLREADGNYVILALGKGRYAFYAHLEPGSVRVRKGQRVRAGDVIGRLGNSGSSTGPHLHFHVMDRPSALDSDGLPYVFRNFRLDGRIPVLTPELEASITAGGRMPVDESRSGGRRNALPLGRDVVSFPG